MLASILETTGSLLFVALILVVAWALCQIANRVPMEGPETHGDEGGHPHVAMGAEDQARWISDLRKIRARQGSRIPHLRPIAGGAPSKPTRKRAY